MSLSPYVRRVKEFQALWYILYKAIHPEQTGSGIWESGATLHSWEVICPWSIHTMKIGGVREYENTKGCLGLYIEFEKFGKWTQDHCLTRRRLGHQIGWWSLRGGNWGGLKESRPLRTAAIAALLAQFFPFPKGSHFSGDICSVQSQKLWGDRRPLPWP